MLLASIILAPLAGAIILGLIGKRLGERAVGLIACSTVAVSTILAFYAFFFRLLPLEESNRRIFETLFTWIRVGSFRTDFSLLLDPLSGVYIVFITFVALWIHIFATGYMRGEEGYWRFFAYLNLFMFAMLTLVLADNFVLMFVGWEGVGLCSYLLIGYYFTKDFANDAAKKAFIVNRIGDVGFALGVLLLFWKAGSVFYFNDPARGVTGSLDWAARIGSDPFTSSALVAGGITTIGLLLFVGATGKSAQIPLFVWLPDAMAGPTPVSALIHAATMVTAGVYLVARSSYIYVKAPSAMMVIAIVGAATAVFAATIGLAQSDIKKVLAYSTISQLGYMFLACGVGAFTAGIFHVFTHAFFKALLFLGSGSVIIGMHHEQDMRKMGGLSKYMRVTFWSMALGWLAISGIPPFSGFFSKDEILFRTFTTPVLPEPWSRILWFTGAVTALLTAIYMTRLMVMTFFGNPRQEDHGHGDEHHSHGHTPKESPSSMTIPLAVLAVGAVVAGWIGIPEGLTGGKIPNYFEHLLEPVIAHLPGQAHPADHTLEIILTLISTVIAIAGITIGWFWFRKQPLWQPPRVLEEKYRVDEAYSAILIQPIKRLSTGFLWKIVDIGIIDGLVNGTAALTGRLGKAMRHLQSGLARSYVAVVVLGALLLIGYFVAYAIN